LGAELPLPRTNYNLHLDTTSPPTHSLTTFTLPTAIMAENNAPVKSEGGDPMAGLVHSEAHYFNRCEEELYHIA
jgi:hypothetical protein